MRRKSVPSRSLYSARMKVAIHDRRAPGRAVCGANQSCAAEDQCNEDKQAAATHVAGGKRHGGTCKGFSDLLRLHCLPLLGIHKLANKLKQVSVITEIVG